MPVVKVVVDTNAVVGDYWLRSKRWRLLLSRADKGLVDLYVPEAIVSEVLKHFRIDLQDAASALATAERKAGRMQSYRAPFEPIDVEAGVAAYEEHLRESLEEVRTDFTNPVMDVNEVTNMLAERKKPFKPDGSGLIDAVLWFRVRELAHEDEVAMISDNYKDFGGTKLGGLDDGLLSQVVDLYDVERYASPTDFHAAALDHAQLYEGEIQDLLGDPDEVTVLKASLNSLLDSREARAAGAWGAIADADSTSYLLGDITKIELIEVAEADPDAGYAAFEVEGTAEYEFPVLFSEGFGALDDGEIDSLDMTDLDDSFGMATRSVTVSMIVDATFDPGSGELSDFEVTAAEA
jgi:hypothetical protein